MRCPRLSELPPPPTGKTGWPWTLESPQLGDKNAQGINWPRISVVTPSYNQASFIEETIRSTLLQGYPNLEYIIMDGGSTDGSVEIISKYAQWLTHWESGLDGGQTKAINNGFLLCSGAIRAWINSDDGFLPSTLRHVAKAFSLKDCDIAIGNSVYKKPGYASYVRTKPVRAIYLNRGGHIPQHSTLWRSSIHEALDESLLCAMDTELWLRLYPKARRVVQLPYALAYVNMHPDQKTYANAWDFARPIDRAYIAKKHGKSWFENPVAIRFINIALKVDAKIKNMSTHETDSATLKKALASNLLSIYDWEYY